MHHYRQQFRSGKCVSGREYLIEKDLPMPLEAMYSLLLTRVPLDPRAKEKTRVRAPYYTTDNMVLRSGIVPFDHLKCYPRRPADQECQGVHNALTRHILLASSRHTLFSTIHQSWTVCMSICFVNCIARHGQERLANGTIEGVQLSDASPTFRNGKTCLIVWIASVHRIQTVFKFDCVSNLLPRT
jgi:hypothetical protein